jgi:aryl-alcohol dehydrogenase-like predicted oxidoreductase
MKNSKLSLGCGLIRIGRVWGVDDKPIPSEKEVRSFLEETFELGIRFYDTAPAYGLSEDRLGSFIQSLTNKQKNEITVATKFGEHWDEDAQSTVVDHSYDALIESLEQSYKKLKKIDLLQLHKATRENIQSSDVSEAFTYSKKMGIKELGASISDLKTGLFIVEDENFNYIQLPYNFERKELFPVIIAANKLRKKIIFNRPFAMGAVAIKEEKMTEIINAFNLILETNASGIVLTGTASKEHLKENILFWNKANEN